MRRAACGDPTVLKKRMHLDLIVGDRAWTSERNRSPQQRAVTDREGLWRATNVIAGEAWLTLDVRHSSDEIRTRAGGAHWLSKPTP